MQKTIEFKGCIVHANSYPCNESIWNGGYWIEIPRSGKRVQEVVHSGFRKTSADACDDALMRGLQYVCLMLAETA